MDQLKFEILCKRNHAFYCQTAVIKSFIWLSMTSDKNILHSLIEQLLTLSTSFVNSQEHSRGSSILIMNLL